MDERLYSRPLDVHRISEYPEVQRMITYLFDEMERRTSVRTQPKNIACVGRYLGMNQNDVTHHLLPFRLVFSPLSLPASCVHHTVLLCHVVPMLCQHSP